jgi:hypothetical protein
MYKVPLPPGLFQRSKPVSNCKDNLAARSEPLRGAVGTIRPGTKLARAATALDNTLVPIAALVVALTRIDNLASVTVVGVDAAQHASILGCNTLDDDIARTAIGGAVTARANYLAVVLGVEVLDGHSAPAVELEDLVRGTYVVLTETLMSKV